MLLGVRVLLVEDDVRMASAMRRPLLGAGVVADVAATGDEARWVGSYTVLLRHGAGCFHLAWER